MPEATVHAAAVATAPTARTADAGESSVFRRVIGLVVGLAAAVILLLAAFLQPAPEGLGTHEQLSMPACGWITMMDLPCPTCGMTTAFAHAANGNLLASVAAQPLGALLAIATAMALLIGSYTAITGSRVGEIFAGMWGRRTGWLLGGIVLAAWVYKVIIYKGLP